MAKSVLKTPAISIVGMGYVGLATAVCFANAGYPVLGVDIDSAKVKTISSGTSPIHENAIESLLKRSLRSKNFSISTDLEKAIAASKITFVTVGTPSRTNGDIDLKYVEGAIHSIAKSIGAKKDYHLVVVKSTIVPGTTSETILPLMKRVSGKAFPRDFGLCFNPELLREGSAVEDTLHPDALIIGSQDERSSKFLLSLYKGFYGKNLPCTLITSPSNAEFVKYAVNSFRATQITFLNSIANLCESIPGTEISEIVRGVSTITKMDPRYQKAGFGFGGSCWPKDLRALIATFDKNGIPADLLKSVLLVNENQAKRAIEIARGSLGNLTGRRISLLGLAFKAGTDDVRESVGIRISRLLISAGAIVSVYDPQAMENGRRELGDVVEYSPSARACIRNTDCCIIATEWEEFRKILPSEFRHLMRNPLIIEGRRSLDYERFEKDKVPLIQLGRYSSIENMSIESVSESIMVRK